MIYLKLFAAVVIFGSLVGNYYLIGSNAEKEAALESVTTAFGTYAGNVEDEISGHEVALKTVMAAYTENDDERARLENTLAKHDLGALAKSKPGLVERRINSGTIKLFAAIEASSRTNRAEDKSPEAEANPF